VLNVNIVVLLAFIGLIGCTSLDVSGVNNSIKEFKIRTSGNLNGFTKNEIIEGRTKGANYKRIMVSYGLYKIITKYAYDCEITKNGVNTMVHIWDEIDSETFTSMLRKLIIDIVEFTSYDVRNDIVLDDESNIFYCNRITLKNNNITLFDKSESKTYLKEHPKTEIFKLI
jgi:hypothetical protein